MSAEQNIGVLRQVIEEAFNKENVDVLDSLFDPNFKEHQFGLSPTIDGMKKDIHNLHKSFPDFHLTIDDVVADKDKVWVRMTGSGTNHGGFMGPPNGKPYRITVFDVIRLENGKVVEHWGSPDRFALLAQLGLLPKPN